MQNLKQGNDSAIFLVGRSGAGKSHSLMGTTHQKGILEVIINDVYRFTNQTTDNTVLMQCCEFLKTTNDLVEMQIGATIDEYKFNKNKPPAFDQRRVSISTKRSQHDLATVQYNNAVDAYDFLKRAISRRHVASTSLNKKSSRKHLLIKISIRGPSETTSLDIFDICGAETMSDENQAESVLINSENMHLMLALRNLLENKVKILNDGQLKTFIQNYFKANIRIILIAHMDLIIEHDRHNKMLAKSLTDITKASIKAATHHEGKIKSDQHQSLWAPLHPIGTNIMVEHLLKMHSSKILAIALVRRDHYFYIHYAGYGKSTEGWEWVAAPRLGEPIPQLQ